MGAEREGAQAEQHGKPGAQTGARLGTPLALLALTLLAAWPLLRAGYPTIGDGLNHFYRLAQLDLLLRAGVWFPRWATDLAYGFGYPVFNFYSPLVYYLGAGLRAAGFSYAGALLGVYGLALGLAVSGAYALAQERWGQAAGLTAAAAYGLAPYLYFNALARGALPETAALGLLPWVLWAYGRLAGRAAGAHVALAAALNAALVLTHLLSALLAAPLVWLAAVEAEHRAHRAAPCAGSPRPAAVSYLWPASSYLLSLALAAFFLLPASLELGAVQAAQLTTPGSLDFHNNFHSLGALLAWPRAFDERLVFNAVPASLSLAAAAIAGAGLIAGGARAWPLRRGHARGEGRPLGLWGLGLLGLALMTLPGSVWVWDHVPLLKLVQFPWRLVGPASLVLALLAGAGMGQLARGRWASLAAAGGIAALWVFSLAWTYGPAGSAPGFAGPADLHAYERASGQLGTTSAGEFLPAGVRALPDPHTLDTAYAAGRPAARLAEPPAGVRVLAQTAGATGAAADVESSAPAVLVFNFFDFPGWQARLNGEPVPITPSDPHGLITVRVPAGRQRVEIGFGSTPLRTGAGLLSVLALGVAVILAARRPATPARLAAPRQDNPGLALSATATAVVLLAARSLALDAGGPALARSRFDGARVDGAEQALDISFANELVLIGMDGPPRTMAADGTLPLTLYWRAQTAPAADYATTVQVLDAAGHLYGQSDSQHPGGLPTSRWLTSQYARDEHRLRLLPGTPPGSYILAAGVYAPGGAALAVQAGGAPQGQLAVLGTLTVTAARRPAEPDAAVRLEAGLGALTLAGYSLSTTAPQAGDELRLTLFWRAAERTRPDVAVQLALVAADGEILAETTAPPAPSYPTSAWAAGALVRSPAALRVPAGAPAGPARLVASLVPAQAPDGPPLSGPLEVAALALRVPARTFDAPPMANTVNAALGEQAVLLGYDLSPAGELVLYWQARATLDPGYKVFVHVLDAQDQLLAQADTVPAAGARPASGWLPGEVIVDRHQVPLAGASRLAVGLYSETTGARLGRVVLSLP